MKIQDLLENIPDFAVDLKLNAKNLLNTTILTKSQAMIIFVACAFATKNKVLLEAILEEASQVLSETEINAGRTSASLMSMTNVYYRFTHLVSNEEYSKMSAGLRMNGLSPSKHGIPAIDFELASAAVSAINGCGMCMDSHEKTLKKHEVESVKIQEAVKIASVVNALSVVLNA
jgi:alkyl hydroperoxide reductase subunit D